MMKSCGCFTSKGASIFIAIFEIIVYSVYLVLICAFGLHFESIGDTSRVRFDEHDDQLASTHFYVSFTIILAYFLSAIGLFVGVLKESGILLKTWMVSRVLLLIIYLLVSMVFWFLYHNHEVSLPKHRIFSLLLSFFFLFAVYSHYTQVTDPLSPQIYRYRMEPSATEIELQQLNQFRIIMMRQQQQQQTTGYNTVAPYWLLR